MFVQGHSPCDVGGRNVAVDALQTFFRGDLKLLLRWSASISEDVHRYCSKLLKAT